jgi:hypothetical protein
MMVEENTDPLDFRFEQKLSDLFDTQSTASTTYRDSDDFSDIGSRKSSKDSYVKPAESLVSAYDNVFGVSGFSMSEESTPTATLSWDQSFGVYTPDFLQDEKTPTTATGDVFAPPPRTAVC